MVDFHKVTIFLLVLVLEPVLAADESCDLEQKLLVAQEMASENDFIKTIGFLDQTITDCYQETKELVDLLQQRGYAKLSLSKYSEALEDFEEALQIVRKKDIGLIAEAEVLQDIGNSHTHLGAYDKGLILLNQSIEIFEESDPDGAALIYAYNKQGINLALQGKVSEAAESYNKAVSKSEILFGKDSPDYATALNNRATNFSKTSDFDLAVQDLKKALSIVEKFPNKGQWSIAIFSNNIASSLTSLGQYEEAQFYLEKAIKQFKEIIPGDHNNLAIMLFNLGHNYREQFKQEQSHKAFKEAAEMVERVLGPEHPGAATTKIGLSISLREQGMIEDSIKLNTQILKVFQDKLDKNSNRLGDLYSLLAQDAVDQKNFEKAEFYFQEVIRITTHNRGRNNSSVSNQLSNYAEFLDNLGRFEEAEELYKESIKIMEELDDKSLGLVERLHEFAVHNYQRTFFNNAIQLELDALKLLDDSIFVPTNSLKAIILSSLSSAYKSIGDLDSAMQFAKKSNYEFEQYLLRNKTETPIDEMKRYEDMQKHYLNHLTWLMEEGSVSSVKEAFKLSQLVSISPISFAINRSKQRKLALTGGETIKQHQDLIERRRLLQKQLDNLYVRSKENQNEINKLVRERKSLDLRITRLGKKLIKENPQYSESIIPYAYAIKEVQKTLDVTTLLIKYMVTDEKVFVWSITNDDLFYYSVNINKKVLEKEVDLIRKANIDYQKPLEDYPFKESFYLYKKLIDPSIKRFKNVNQLLVNPHESLHLLSFNSLVDSEIHNTELKGYSWLIKKTPISILPSISSLFYLRPILSDSFFDSFVGIGNPSLKGTRTLEELFNARGGMNISEVKLLPSLPESQSELEEIGKTIGTANVFLLLKEEATDENLLSLNLENVDLLAFATHAVNAYLGYGIEEPGLVMSGLESDKIDDWLLTSSEIKSLNLKAKLVILSACNTASIGTKGQNAYSGLAESFFYAGANSVLVSQWPVASNAAVELTTTMLSNYEKDSSISMSKALQKSMLSLIQRDESSYQHPFFWAPFVLVGVN